MSKTWETLFHLSSFMKYLLLEILPNENSSCPQYLIDSLFELLNVTLECIQLVQGKNVNNGRSMRENFHNEVANVAIIKAKEHLENSFESYPLENSHNAEECGNARINTNVSRIPESGYQSEYPPKKKKVNDLALKLLSAESKTGLIRHQSVILSKNFLFLNEQAISGEESFGSFCIPCDKCFFEPNDWSNHLTHDYQHANIKATCEEVCCEKCKFIIYGSSGFTSVYLDFHYKAHKGVANTQDKLKGESSAGQHKSKTNSVSVNTQNIKTAKSKEIKHETFYCGACGKKYSVLDDWIKHLKHKHQKEIHQSGFSNLNESNLMVSKNICKSDDTLSSMSVSSRSEFNNAPSERNLHSSSSNRQGEHSKMPRGEPRNYVICRKFIDFSNMIHDRNITESYYCRPCDISYTHKSKWEEHCSTEKHISYMNDANFKNFEAICDYCNLVFIGTSKSLKEYMKYHTSRHEKLPSYSINDINDKKDQTKIKRQRTRKRDTIDNRNNSKNKGFQDKNNLNCREEENVHHNYHPPTTRKGPESTNASMSAANSSNSSMSAANSSNSSINSQLGPENPSDSNWFTVSRNEEIMSTLKKMHLARKKQLISGQSPLFGGFCLVCDVVIEDAFEWMDHCGQEEHSSRVGKDDKEFVFNNLNLTVFGNQLQFKDFVPL